MIESLVAAALALQLYADPQWLKLVHYRPTLFRAHVSDVDSPEFFLATDGKRNPKAELEATIRALLTGPTGDAVASHPQCLFPARTQWLSQKLGDGFTRALPPVPCRRQKEFLSRVPRQSVHLVFSSFYVNNPSSSFGHTLLRFSHAPPGATQAPELMDIGINYAANPTTNNALLYAIMGLSGGFSGTFSAVRYYEKVREYNDAEARDLWSYELSLSREEIDLLAAHVWEMGQISLDYFYLTENCAFHMLTLLEAAAPRLNLTSRSAYWVIPSDTVQTVVREPGLVRHRNYRPSARARFLSRYNSLSSQEKSAVKHVAALIRYSHKSSSAVEGDIPPQQFSAATLDTLLDYIEYAEADGLRMSNGAAADGAAPPNGQPPSTVARWRNALLKARALNPAPPTAATVTTPENQAPENGHGSARFQLGGGAERQGHGRFAEFGLRFALHDLLDPAAGYPRDAWIEFLNLRGRLYVDQLSRSPKFSDHFELTEFTAFRVTSLNPVRFHNRAPSWRIQVGYLRVPDLNCQRCGAGRAEFGAGYTTGDDHSMFTAYLLNNIEASVSGGYFGSKLRLGLGPMVGVLLRPSSWWGVHSSVSYRHLFFAKKRKALRIQAEAQVNLPLFRGPRNAISGAQPAPRFALRAMASREANLSEASLAALYYF
jgi:hypothetical protein